MGTFFEKKVPKAVDTDIYLLYNYICIIMGNCVKQQERHKNMIRSMTAYGRAKHESEARSVLVEIGRAHV